MSVIHIPTFYSIWLPSEKLNIEFLSKFLKRYSGNLEIWEIVVTHTTFFIEIGIWHASLYRYSWNEVLKVISTILTMLPKLTFYISSSIPLSNCYKKAKSTYIVLFDILYHFGISVRKPDRKKFIWCTDIILASSFWTPGI